MGPRSPIPPCKCMGLWGAEMLAVIGGHALVDADGWQVVAEHCMDNAWGQPSSLVRELEGPGGHRHYQLARHGDDLQYPPHSINYRANMQALKQLRADAVLSLCTVGGICHAMGELVVPDQLIDYTADRGHSFHDAGPVRHIDFSEPFAADLRRKILDAARGLGEALVDGGVYGCTQGPRLETAAEIVRMQRDGCTMVGMTAMPEAALAREAGLPYAVLASVVNPAAGINDGPLDQEQLLAEAQVQGRRQQALLAAMLASWPG